MPGKTHSPQDNIVHEQRGWVTDSKGNQNQTMKPVQLIPNGSPSEQEEEKTRRNHLTEVLTVITTAHTGQLFTQETGYHVTRGNLVSPRGSMVRAEYRNSSGVARRPAK